MRLIVENRLDLSAAWQEAGSHHEALGPHACAPVTVAGVAELAVLVVPHRLSLGKVPGAPLTDTIRRAIWMNGAEMLTLGFASLDPGTIEPFGSLAVWGGYRVYDTGKMGHQIRP